jgi:hypothetical protein
MAMQSGGAQLSCGERGQIRDVLVSMARGRDAFVIRVKSMRFVWVQEVLVVQTGSEHGETAKLIFDVLHISPA